MDRAEASITSYIAWQPFCYSVLTDAMAFLLLPPPLVMDACTPCHPAATCIPICRFSRDIAYKPLPAATHAAVGHTQAGGRQLYYRAPQGDA